jgi:hypothetical protein
MSKLSRVTLLLALAIGFFGAYRYGAAQEARSSKGRARITPATFDVQVSQDPNVLATNHVLERTYNNNGVYDAEVPASTFTPIDNQLTVQCPGKSGSGTCTIQADMWVENGDGGGNSSDSANNVCLYVDGNPAGLCSYTAGQTSSGEIYVQTSTSQSVTGLAPGNHTVQTYFAAVSGAYVYYYNANYQVYKP